MKPNKHRSPNMDLSSLKAEFSIRRAVSQQAQATRSVKQLRKRLKKNIYLTTNNPRLVIFIQVSQSDHSAATKREEGASLPKRQLLQ